MRNSLKRTSSKIRNLNNMTSCGQSEALNMAE